MANGKTKDSIGSDRRTGISYGNTSRRRKRKITEGDIMKKYFCLISAVILAISVSLVGCGAKKAESGKAAITEAKTMPSVQEKTDYLVGQAKAFYNSKQFQDSVDVAQYILRYLDKDSPQAKDLLQKAKDQIAAQMKQQARQVKQNFGIK